RVVKFHSRKLNAKRIVIMGQMESVCMGYCIIDNELASRHHPFFYGFIMDIKIGNAHIEFPSLYDNLIRMEIGNAVDASKNNLAILIYKCSIFAELISL